MVRSKQTSPSTVRKSRNNQAPGIILAALFPLFGLVSCTPPQSIKVAAYSPDQILASSVFDQVNEYRKNKGSGPLRGHPGLNRLAAKHSDYMRKNRGTFEIYGKNVTHMGSEGRAVVATKNYKFINCSENVAAAIKGASDTQSAAKLVRLWENSPSHEAAMRAREYTHTGVGTVTDFDGTVFATQIFGTLTDSHMGRRERFGPL